MINYKLIAYSTSSKGEVKLKQNQISGVYCVEFNGKQTFGKLLDVWADFRLTRGNEIRYVGFND